MNNTITIGGQDYALNFGFQFLKEIDKTKQITQNGASENAGLQFAIANLIDGDPVTLVDVIVLANRCAKEEPKITQKVLMESIEEGQADIDYLYDRVLEFLKNSPVTRKKTQTILEQVEKMRAEN